MNEQQKHIWQAITINTLLLIAAGIIIWTWRGNRPPSSQPLTPQEQQAEIALEYIQTLAAYQELGSPSALLQKMEFVGTGIWVAQFETRPEGDIRHHYFLEIQDGRVIRHDITVMDAAKTLFLYSPEPEEIIGTPALTVKGKTIPGASVDAQILDQGTSRTRQSKSGSAADATGEFVFELDRLVSGEFDLVIGSEDARISIPIIVQTNL